MFNRRNLLKTISTGVVSIAGARAMRARAGETKAAASGDIGVRVTAGNRRFAEASSLKWRRITGSAADSITIDPDAGYQEILGFGAAMTDASCYLLSRLNDADRKAVMHDLFAPQEMALNVCRTCIGASDYSRTMYSFDESPEPDPEMKKFSIGHDKEYILPMLREARKENPELFLF